MTMLGTFRVNSWVAAFSATGVILSAAYALYLYRRIIFGVLDKPSLKDILDLSGREIALLGPLFALTLYYGIHPGPILDSSAASVQAMIKTFDESTKVKAATAAPAPANAAQTAVVSKWRRFFHDLSFLCLGA